MGRKGCNGMKFTLGDSAAKEGRLDENLLAAAMYWQEAQCKAQGTYEPGVLPKSCACLVEWWMRARSEAVTFDSLTPQARESLEHYLTAIHALEDRVEGSQGELGGGE